LRGGREILWLRVEQFWRIKWRTRGDAPPRLSDSNRGTLTLQNVRQAADEQFAQALKDAVCAAHDRVLMLSRNCAAGPWRRVLHIETQVPSLFPSMTAKWRAEIQRIIDHARRLRWLLTCHASFSACNSPAETLKAAEKSPVPL